MGERWESVAAGAMGALQEDMARGLLCIKLPVVRVG